MEVTNTDSRQEWFEELYYCEKCEKTFLRTVVFKTQSELVESDELEEI